MKTQKGKRPMRIPTARNSFIVSANDAQTPKEEQYENPDILDAPVPEAEEAEEEFLEDDFDVALTNPVASAELEPEAAEESQEDEFAEEVSEGDEAEESEIESTHLTPDEPSVPVFGRPVVRNLAVEERPKQEPERQTKTAATTGIRWKKR